MAGEVFSNLITSVNPKVMNSGSRQGIKIDRIILHHNATTNKDVAMNTWVQGGAAGTSAHYEITPTEIIGCVGEQYAAWHAGGTGPADPPRIANPNYRSIGLENLNSTGAPNWLVDTRTITNCARLVADICKRYGIPCDRQHVLGHNEVTATACPGGMNVDEVVRQAKQFLNGSAPKPSKPTPAPTPQAKKNGIAIDNVSKDQAAKIVQRVQTNYAWTLLRDKVKAVKQKDGRYTLSIRTGRGKRQEQTRARLSQELKSYYPGYIQSNVALVNGDKDSATLEARNMPASAFNGKNPFDVHMRNFLKDILLDGQTYAEANAYGTYDVRIKGEGFNDHDAAIVLKQIQDLGKAKDLKIDSTHIKGFKY
ncbi:peptidoglycan recognition family protein [Enterococcus dongliensis]|uniref:peptidoglycan recognition protein family protein n=1 Tax=Enterococcus dongliensis TaxID=2559925 RepID=UPI00288F36FF|nr:peptidoglycan recognition family protein [Enterococcus dongliensis]MDT2648018.1 peptidoglycan recognition family protein [Enterococcus dongliensis]